MCMGSRKLTQIKIQINILRSQKEFCLFPTVAKAQLGMVYDETDRDQCWGLGVLCRYW